MNWAILKNHFLQLKLLNQFPNHFLIHSVSLAVNKMGEEILKTLNCPHQTNCAEDCSYCRQFMAGDENVIYKVTSQSTSITRKQIDNLRNWAYLHASTKFVRFFWIVDAHLLTISARNQLLKFLEETPPGIIGLFTTREWRQLSATLLSRLQIFSVEERNPQQEWDKTALVPTEQKILGKLSETAFSVIDQDFINQKFIPLKLQTDLFLHHLHKKEIRFFLINSEEAFIRENFWLFLQILILQIQFVLWEDELFAAEQTLLKCEMAKLPRLLQKILQLLAQNDWLFQKIKNTLSTKLVFLDFFYDIQNLFTNNSKLK